MSLGLITAHHGLSSGVTNTEKFDYSLELHQVQDNINIFEFNLVNNFSFAFNDTSIELDLTVNRTGWNRIDFGVNNTHPQLNDFNFGSDSQIVLPGNGVINPTNYDLELDSNDPTTSSYDLNLSSGEQTVIPYYFSDEIFGSGGQGVEIDLFHELRLEYNLHICGFAYGSTIRPQIQSITTSNGDLDNTLSDVKLSDSTLEFVFDNMTQCSGDYDLLEIINGASISVDLTVDKTLEYEITLCPEIRNPDINETNHDFIHLNEFVGLECGAFEFEIYAGSYCEADVQQPILISMDGYSGSYVDNDLTIFKILDCDATHGTYSDNDLTPNPAAELDMDAYSGSYGDSDLTTFILFTLDIDSGSYSDSDFSIYPAAELDMDAYSGEDSESDLLTIPVIHTDTAYHGLYSDSDFSIFPSIEVDLNEIPHGSYSDGDLTIFIQFYCDGYSGGYSDSDLEIVVGQGFGDVDATHGSYSETDTLSRAPALDSDATHGSYSDSDLLLAQNLDSDGYHGLYSDLDFTLNLPDELDSEGYHGVDSEYSLSTTRALFPRANHGSYADFDLTDFPAQEIELDSYHGAISEIDDLVETEFNTFAYHGAYSDVSIQVSFNLPAEEAQHGAYSESDTLFVTPSLDSEANHGANSVISTFEVPQGEGLECESHHGSNLEVALGVTITPIINLREINAGIAMYDGLGGVGGLNHCPVNSSEIDPLYGDNVIRLGYDPLGMEDNLNVEFADFGDAPWETCNSGGMKCEIALQTNPRFDLDFESGSNMETFIPLEILALIGDVPPSRLYDFEYTAIVVQPIFDVSEIGHGIIGEVWDHPDEFITLNGSHMEVNLTPTAFGEHIHGSYSESELSTVEYSWKYASEPAYVGQTSLVSFEPIEYIRFCKGYIQPNGNSVVFEFGIDSEVYDCELHIGYGGASSEFDLTTFKIFEFDGYNGEYSNTGLTIQDRLTLLAYHGATSIIHIYEEPELETIATHGSYVECSFYEPPVIGYGGATSEIDDLIVPGPAVRWQTESGCLPNDYKPTTDSGDIDYEALEPDENGVVQYPSVPVEFKQYYYVLDARCVAFGQSEEDSE